MVHVLGSVGEMQDIEAAYPRAISHVLVDDDYSVAKIP
jgi:hypothetical protein